MALFLPISDDRRTRLYLVRGSFPSPPWKLRRRAISFGPGSSRGTFRRRGLRVESPSPPRATSARSERERDLRPPAPAAAPRASAALSPTRLRHAPALPEATSDSLPGPAGGSHRATPAPNQTHAAFAAASEPRFKAPVGAGGRPAPEPGKEAPPPPMARRRVVRRGKETPEAGGGEGGAPLPAASAPVAGKHEVSSKSGGKTWRRMGWPLRPAVKRSDRPSSSLSGRHDGKFLGTGCPGSSKYEHGESDGEASQLHACRPLGRAGTISKCGGRGGRVPHSLCFCQTSSESLDYPPQCQCLDASRKLKKQPCSQLWPSSGACPEV